MRQSCFIFVLFILLGCNAKKESQEVDNTTDVFYKQSEMAALMLQMYAVNSENKRLILAGESVEKLTDFSEEFQKIYTAILTDSTDRDVAFKEYSNLYLKNYKMVFNTTKDSLKLKHNNAINSCIACHKTTCLGPIPKIKKLLIQ